MTTLDEFIHLAKSDSKRIALAEGEDPRIVEAAIRAAGDGLAEPVLVGNQAAIVRQLDHHDAKPSRFLIIDPATSPLAEPFAERYLEKRKHKGVDWDAARAAMRDPLGFATMLTEAGETHGTIGGAVATTADTVRAALQIIGRASGVDTVSSFFLMALDKEHHAKNDLLIFADCALNIDPDATALSQIAVASADSYRTFTGLEPRVAMLSFSTAGSAAHARVDTVAEAARLARSSRPDLILDGDIQFDAAFVPTVSAAKAPLSPLGGEANVMVFPNLEAANIGYKIAQRIGGATAIGPILQGLAKPANDLSRGCSADDVYHMMAITSVQAGQTT